MSINIKHRVSAHTYIISKRILLIVQNVCHSNININIKNHPAHPPASSPSPNPPPTPSPKPPSHPSPSSPTTASTATATRGKQASTEPSSSAPPISDKFSAAAAGRNAKPLSAGEIGENITTEGVELSTLPLGTELHFLGGEGEEAVVVLTGVREPGPGMDKCRPGLKDVCVVRDGGRVVKRLAGVMGTVKKGGMLRPGMGIKIVKPASVRSLPVV
ncbi:hypothetical protein Asppvi_003343 [Aspergillus pseudoviridinutans]|uniref:MOSC domain-containing protein n=1 Tax=Aspergillus pseudoviridinutans TaxID=1517512 RepID=A0A9P3B4C7_9EURO|nr:uncharacterized protein Asppvi_003343 [Aspergillus pseudoviridinutans]GIJ84496.1 hypothetical protein Asppvi_003343 [Aspergillus pseudoviridinutans]